MSWVQSVATVKFVPPITIIILDGERDSGERTLALSKSSVVVYYKCENLIKMLKQRRAEERGRGTSTMHNREVKVIALARKLVVPMVLEMVKLVVI